MGRWPQIADFNEPRLLHLPVRRKALNSLTWDVWFSLINGNLLMFWLSWLLSYLFRTVAQSYMRGYVPGLSPQQICQIKRNSQLFGHALFLTTRKLHKTPQVLDTYLLNKWKLTGFLSSSSCGLQGPETLGGDSSPWTDQRMNGSTISTTSPRPHQSHTTQLFWEE